MHRAARRVLANYQTIGEPFSLFLSSWSFDEKRKAALSLLEGSTRRVEVRIGLERQVRILLKLQGLETIAIYRKGDYKRIAKPDEWPALTLGHDWQARVAAIAAKADLITLFWGATTPGLTEELRICLSGTTPMKTVVVVSGDARAVWQTQLHRSFPRVVPLEEIPPFFALHPEFTPLIDRMQAIMSVDSTIRSGFLDPDERIRRFPLPPPSGRFDGDLWIEHTSA